MELRPYQIEAKRAIYNFLRRQPGNPCAVLPTGSGKTPLIADICRDARRWNRRVLVLAHVKELLEQTADKLRTIDPDLDFGIHSAGLGRRDTDQQVILAGIQSAHRRAAELGTFHLVVVDEAHTIPPSGDGMYRSLLSSLVDVNPTLRLLGLTATPYRLACGPICGPDNLLTDICCEIPVRDLIAQGYLSPLTTRAGAVEADTGSLHLRGGEFIASEMSALMDSDQLVRAAVEEIVDATRDRRGVLVFCSSVEHAQHVARVLADEAGEPCGFICGDTPDTERADLIDQFKAGELRFMANVNVLTTGFDAPHVDAVALLRPTMSPGLFYQMVGRGLRLAPGKQDCLVLDFAGNALRHGPVDAIKAGAKPSKTGGGGRGPAKQCPECRLVVAVGVRYCPCGYDWGPRRTPSHGLHSDGAPVLTGQEQLIRHRVERVLYAVHQKRDAPDTAPRSLRVTYQLPGRTFFSEFICVEHSRWVGQQARKWWQERSDAPMPRSASGAYAIAIAGGLAEPTEIVVRHVGGKPFPEITPVAWTAAETVA